MRGQKKSNTITVDMQEYNNMVLDRNRLRTACAKAFGQIEASKSYPPCLESAKRILKEALND